MKISLLDNIVGSGKPLLSLSHLLLLFFFMRVGCVLARVGFLVVEIFDKLVVAGGNQGSHDRTEPVNVVVSGEIGCRDSRAETACWVEGCTGPSNT